MKAPKTKTLATVIPALFAGLVSASVAAQTPAPATTPPKTEKIEVTGSLIKRVDSETPSPILIITKEQIKNSGYATIDELLRTYSAMDATSIQDGAASGFIGGISTISMRGLGSQSTLVLINGRRLAPVAAVDINFGRGSLISTNTIPKEAIERIEILKDGASALYGSDALAGVVNFVLKKDYQGLDLSASYGANDKGAGVNTRAAVTFGIGSLSENRYNIFGGAEVMKRDRVMHSELKDRGNLGQLQRHTILNNAFEFYTPNSAASGVANFYRYPASTAGTTVLDGRTVANSSLFGANYLSTGPGCAPQNTVGQGVPIRPPGAAANTASLIAGQCRYDLDDADEAIAEQDRVNASVRGSFAISDSTTAYADFMYSQTKSNERAIPRTITTTLVSQANPIAVTTPLTDGSFRTSNGIILPIGHPDNPTNGSATPQAVQVIYRFTDVPTDDINDLKSYRTTVGLQGSWGAWDYDAALLHSRQDNERTQKGRIRESLLRQAIATGSYRFNGNNDAAAVATIASDAVNTGESTITSFDMRASRELFKLSGGMAAIAVGVEARREEFASVPSDIYRSGDFIGLVANGAEGSRDVQAMFAELSLPLIKSLEAQLAVRHEKYSDFGNATTGKMGFKYDAVPSIFSVRGTAATGFRAPSIAQINDSAFLLSFHNDQTRRYIDPLRCDPTQFDNPVTRGSLGPFPTARDCNVLTFTAVPAGQHTGTNLATVITGNPDVQAETTRSFTLGIIFSPTRDIDVSFDWWRFRRNEEIRVQLGRQIMEAYIANPAANEHLLIRDPNPATWLAGVPNSGPILALRRGYGNFNFTETSGFDYDVNFRFPVTAWGKFGVTLNGTVTRQYDRQIQDTDPVERLVGSSTVDLPKYKWNVTMSWSKNALSGWIRHNTQSGLNRGVTSDTCLAGASAANAYLSQHRYCHVGTEKTLDIGGSWRGIKNLTVAASLLNVLNYYGHSINVPSSFNYWNSGSTAMLGRRFNLNVDYKFK